MLSVEDWAEIRRLHRAEGMPIKAIARVLGVSRNTVRAALASDGPPKYVRPAQGSVVDAVEPRIRELLQAYPTMPATVIAERIGWPRRITDAERTGWRSCGRRICRRTRRRRTTYAAGRAGAVRFLVPADHDAGRVRAGADGEAAAGADDGVGVLALAVGGADPVPAGPRTCSRAGGSSSSGSARCRGRWCGTARARSAGGGRGSSRADRRLPGVPRHAGREGDHLQARRPRGQGPGRAGQ